jgi:hypothetical protein
LSSLSRSVMVSRPRLKIRRRILQTLEGLVSTPMRRTDVLVILLACHFTTAPCRAQILTAGSRNSEHYEEALGTRIPTYAAHGRTAAQCLVDLAYRYQIPIGIEYVDHDFVSKKIKLNIRGGTVRSVVAALASQIPPYRVTFGPGAVEIFTPEARADKSNLLNTTIDEFSVSGSDPVEADSRLFVALEHKFHRSVFSSTAPGQLGPQKVTLDLRGRRVRQILDAIVAQHGSAIWTVIVPPNDLSNPALDLWHMYSLEPRWESEVIERLSNLFPQK